MKNSTKIDPYGFREYDARWIYEKDISIEGIEELGKGLGTQIKIHTKKENPRVVVGHDYRSYSEEIKSSLKKGLIFTGCYVEDIGLSLSPMVYFAQFNLNTDAVAMVTASHNENGWTGVKMGIKKGLTHAPEEMKELKEITLNQKFTKGNGNQKKIDDFQQIYKNDLISKNQITKKIKAVVACGNGTAGIFAPDILRGIGCEVIELDCNLDWTFPKYNPNPEDLEMLHEIAKVVKENEADIGFGFDGDGDRVGVIDEQGNEIFSDKIDCQKGRPGEQKWTPKTAKGYQNYHLATNNVILMIFGNFLVSFWSRFGPPAAIMRPERVPRRAKMDPKNSQGVPK